MGNGEDHMKVVCGQQFPLASGEPAFSRLGLALGTVPISARVIGYGRLVSAFRTGIDVAAQRCSTAALNGPKRLELLKVDATLVPVEEAVALCAEDVGHLHDGPAHFCLVRWRRRSEELEMDRCSSGFT